MSTSSTVVVLTNWFPEKAGDGTFVMNEIDALAGAYDRVIVAPFISSPGNTVHTLPPRTSALPSVCTSRWQIVTKGLFNRLPLKTWISLWRQDRPQVRTRARLVQFIGASLTGRAVASHEPLRSALSQSPAPDLYCFWAIGPAYALPWLPQRVERRVAVRFHGSDVYENAHNGYLPHRKAILDSANLLLPVSDHAAEHLRAYVRPLRVAARPRIAVSRLGTQDRGSGLARSTRSTRPIHLVSCSSVDDNKRVALIWSVVKEIGASRSTKWTHFGKGPGYRALERVTQAPPPSIDVVLKGQVPNDEIHQFYETEHVDCFINLSLSEGVPISIMEAVSHNIPVVATNVGGTSELVGNTQGTGCLVEVNSPPTIIAATVLQVVTGGNYPNPRSFWESNCRSEECASRLVAVMRDAQ